MIEINIITKKEADTTMKTEKEGDVQEAWNIMAVERKETKDIHLHRVPAVLAHVQSLDLGQSIRPIGGDLRYTVKELHVLIWVIPFYLLHLVLLIKATLISILCYY